jgi:type IV pilus assembly protein PilW
MLDMARLALDEMALEVMQAGYYGKVSGADLIAGRSDAPDAITVGDLPANDCEAGWTSELTNSLVVDDNVTSLLCVPGTRLAGTDVLVVRRVGGLTTTAAAPALLNADVLYVASEQSKGLLFKGAADLSAFAPTTEIRPLVTHVYYVSTDGEVSGTQATLRRVTLSDGPEYLDVELVPGVEDVQIESGVDVDGDGSVDAYVAPTATGGSQVLALRVNLMIHALARDQRYTDNNEYAALGSAGRRVILSNRRRMQFSRTVMLRNAS